MIKQSADKYPRFVSRGDRGYVFGAACVTRQFRISLSFPWVFPSPNDAGSGKTTQVPHYVLEAAAAAGRLCNVVVAQPRRISAMSVAERVAAERGEKIGDTV